MDFAAFEQMKAWIGFSASEASLLQQAGGALEPQLPGVIDRFYERLAEDAETRATLKDEAQIRRLRTSLLGWLRELFSGSYDRAYLERRSRIGRTHVQVGLANRFMVPAMNLIRTQLTAGILGLKLKSGLDTINALNKLLDLELMIILESYSEDYVFQIRAADRRAMQERIDEVQHMASLGQLAASLAHEIKNPLAGISGAVQIMAKHLAPTDPHREIMKQILMQVQRLDNTVKDLLVFARPRAPDLRECDVGDSVRACLMLLMEDPIVKSLDIEYEGLDQGIRACLDRAQFEQVLSNVLLNAAQACHGCGRVRISVSENRHQVTLSISDNGPGMTPEIRARATEPFFTTNAKGTGLGLAICKRIIEAHQGHLEIESAPQQGTTLHLHLQNAKTGGSKDR